MKGYHSAQVAGIRFEFNTAQIPRVLPVTMWEDETLLLGVQLTTPWTDSVAEAVLSVDVNTPRRRRWVRRLWPGDRPGRVGAT